MSVTTSVSQYVFINVSYVHQCMIDGDLLLHATQLCAVQPYLKTRRDFVGLLSLAAGIDSELPEELAVDVVSADISVVITCIHLLQVADPLSHFDQQAISPRFVIVTLNRF